MIRSKATLTRRPGPRPPAVISTITPLGGLDLVDEADFRRLAGSPGPCVSMFLPTHRSGPQTRQDPLRFQNLLDQAAAELGERGLSAGETREILTPAARLLDDPYFWRHLADGLAIFVAPGCLRLFRVPLDLSEDVCVADRFRLRPLMPLLSGDGQFFVLTLSQKDVRIFAATRSTMAPLALGPTPANMSEALGHEDREPQLQVRSAGRDGAAGRSIFHGHGLGDEIDKQALERFFRAVDGGLREVLGGARHPLVLASVAYYLPIFRAVTTHPQVLEEGVAGNPDHLSPRELHARAWEIVAPALSVGRREATERLGAAIGNGRAALDINRVAAAAHHGRVDTLFVAAADAVWGRLDPTGSPRSTTTASPATRTSSTGQPETPSSPARPSSSATRQGSPVDAPWQPSFATDSNGPSLSHGKG